MNLFSVPISITSKSEALAIVNDWLRKRRTIKFITTPNPEMIVAAQSDPEFLKALQSADLAIPDGVGIVWALKSLSLRGSAYWRKRGNLYKSDSHAYSPERSRRALISPGLGMTDIQISNLSRVSGLDFMEALIGESAKFGWKVMLLGGKPGVAQKVKRHCEARRRRAVAISTITALSGPQNIENSSKSENDRLISEINSYSPDLLFVAFGHGKQEKWLNANRDRLNAGVAMGVGGAFDQIADPSLRPPAIINSIGLGWLYRLLREPWRRRRQLALIRFAGMVARTLIDPSTLRQLADRSG